MQRSGIGLFGGTFDPIHLGHLRLACALRDELRLSKVYLIPAGQPYHKTALPVASAAQRLAMVKLAIQGEPLLFTDDRDAVKQTPTYTVETLSTIRQEVGSKEVLWYLMGMDAFRQLTLWKDWKILLTLTNIAVALRDKHHAKLPTQLDLLWQARQSDVFSHQVAGRLYCLHLPPKAIASRDLREQLMCGKHDQTLVPQAVLDYMTREAIYYQPA
ncbi:MAG: nicotinate-nucleotide adenylyltransferase [Neisseriales bacterium]|nr:MAG: nicotinate-nucleotide adenylyltransferase [Neisseriales bacterium]